MPIPSSIADISTTATSNSPSGTDAIGTSLDDYLRAIQAIIKQQDSKGTDVASGGTIDVPPIGRYFVVTGTTTISAISDDWIGRTVILKFSGALTLTHSAALILPGAANITVAAGDIVVFVNESTGVWRCVAYSRSDGVPITTSGTDTLTNKTIALGSNTVSGTKAQFDTACSDDEFAYVGQSNVFTQPQTINRSASTSIAEYAFDVRQSGGTANAGRPMLSQGATYGFAWSVNSSGSSSAFVDFQWVQRSDGALQSTPLKLRYNGNAENPTGSILVTNSSGLVGYGAGAGGTVTQGTSRTTAVTLNKPTGEITLVSAAGSASFQSFTVNNSTVAATDQPIVDQKSGTDLYEIHVTNIAAGSFRITYRTTGGTTTEQPVFRFTVLKGVSA